MFCAKSIIANSAKRSLIKQTFLSIRMVSSREVDNMKVPAKTIGTHSGKFHCDEVLAVCMLREHPKFKSHGVLRTRDLKLLDQCDIIVDVGAVYDPSVQRFDHHQPTFNETFSTVRPEFGEKFSDIRLSSAGLVYVHYGQEIIAEILNKKFDTKLTENQLNKVFTKIYSCFVQEIDAIDNGIPQFDAEPRYKINTHLSNRVENFNPDWMDDKTSKEVDEAFEEAVKYVASEFLDKIKYFGLSWLPARKIVEAAFQNRFNVHESGSIIELEKFCPWQEHLKDIENDYENKSEIKFVLYNTGNNNCADYRVHTVPIERGSFVSRKSLNKKWLGLRDETLEKASGIKGGNFVHATGFIGGNKTRDGSLEMAIMSLNDGE